MIRTLTAIIALSLANSVAFAERGTPQEQIDSFFEILGSQGAREAVGYLTDGTTLADQKGSQMEAIIAQFETALKIYGSVRRIEPVDERKYGESLVRYRFITFHDSGIPLFWRMTFFKKESAWEIYTFTFNDQLTSIFNDG